MKPSVKTQVLDIIAAAGKPVRFVDIQAMIVNIRLGRPYISARDRGYYSSAFSKPSRRGYGGYYTSPTGYFMKPGWEKRYLVKGADGLYYICNQ